LTRIGLFSAENDALFECFGICCDNAYLCNNCKNILVNLYRKFACIKERCMRIIRSISVGIMSPSKLTRRKDELDILGVCGTPKSGNVGLSPALSISVNVGRMKRLVESPSAIQLSPRGLRYSPYCAPPVVKPAEKKFKRSLFASCLCTGGNVDDYGKLMFFEYACQCMVLWYSMYYNF
jgi:hypothetical protein